MAAETDHKPEEMQGVAQGLTRREALLQLLRVGSVAAGATGERPPADDWDWTYPFRATLTFVLALVGWVFFRAADLRQSVQVLGQMFGGSGGSALLEPWHLGLAALALVLAVGEEKWEWFERAIRAPMPVYAAALALMLFCLEIFGVLDAAIPFIYFQF